MIHHGDCLTVMATMPDASVDAIVTDPPYDLTTIGRKFQGSGGSIDERTGRVRSERRGGGFMGKAWDGTGIAFRVETWAEAFRVAKPGTYLLAFGGTRTSHRLACAIEDAGWIIRDTLCWIYASGFPKGKANLKPAFEPIVMARKPGPLRPLAIDECRIGYAGEADKPTQEEWNRAGSSGQPGANGYAGQFSAGMKNAYAEGKIPVPSGRWPANVILTDPIFDGGVEGVVGGGATGAMPGTYARRGGDVDYDATSYRAGVPVQEGYGDTGTYSRFFLIPKASRSDREPLLGGLPVQRAKTDNGGEFLNGSGNPYNAMRANHHPTVKPTELMRHLVRLVTPPGGTVLDPFLGSGSTAIAAEQEGFAWIGIEKEAEYVSIAEARLNGTQRGLGLEVPA